MEPVSFAGTAIVACGTLSLELNALKASGFLTGCQITYTTPGLHEDPAELEAQLVQRIQKSLKKAYRVVVVYGGKFCYVNAEAPERTMKTIIGEQGPKVRRIQASHCVDMLASAADREKIALEVAGGENVWWMTPGWIEFRDRVFKGWDKGLANENFPRHQGGQLFSTASGMSIGIWRIAPKNFSSTPIGWEFPSSPTR